MALTYTEITISCYNVDNGNTLIIDCLPTFEFNFSALPRGNYIITPIYSGAENYQFIPAYQEVTISNENHHVSFGYTDVIDNYYCIRIESPLQGYYYCIRMESESTDRYYCVKSISDAHDDYTYLVDRRTGDYIKDRSGNFIVKR